VIVEVSGRAAGWGGGRRDWSCGEGAEACCWAGGDSRRRRRAALSLPVAAPARAVVACACPEGATGCSHAWSGAERVEKCGLRELPQRGRGEGSHRASTAKVPPPRWGGLDSLRRFHGQRCACPWLHPRAPSGRGCDRLPLLPFIPPSLHPSLPSPPAYHPSCPASRSITLDEFDGPADGAPLVSDRVLRGESCLPRPLAAGDCCTRCFAAFCWAFAGSLGSVAGSCRGKGGHWLMPRACGVALTQPRSIPYALPLASQPRFATMGTARGVRAKPKDCPP
jgi:hypothetical protein